MSLIVCFELHSLILVMMEFSFDVEGNDVVDEALNKSDNGVKLMTMMINMKKTMMLITSMIMSPASLTLSLLDPQEP